MGLLSDCHRRIEKFLAVLLSVARDRQGGPLDERGREGLEKALRYFKNAAPNHTCDEESSLFPRLRQSEAPDVRELMAQVDQLEQDHRLQEQRHEQVDGLVNQWLADGVLEGPQTALLIELLEALQNEYQQHIALEDNRVFPVAQRILSDNQLRAMGREMAQRRGLDASLPPRRCQHGKHDTATGPDTPHPAGAATAPPA